MKLKNLLAIFTVAILTLSLSSCLDSDDNGGTAYVSGSDVATVQGYSTNRVNFTVDTDRGTAVTLYADQNGKIDPDKFPAGSRVYITYQMLLGQDTDLPVKIDLMSTVGVTTIQTQQGTAEQCKLDYPQFVVNKIYRTGNYINMVCQVLKDENRTWNCYVSPQAEGSAVQIYLDTQAPDAENSRTTQVISINVGSLIGGSFNEIKLHVNNQQMKDYTYSFPLTTADK